MLKDIIGHSDFIISQLDSIDLKNDMVYLGGSITEGFGNQKSDIDVFVICNEVNIDKEKNKNNSLLFDEDCGKWILNIIHDNIRYDFEFITWKYFSDIVSRLNNLNFNTNNYINGLSEREIDFIHRFKHAIPILNEQKFSTEKEKLNFDNLNKYIVADSSILYSSLVEDVQGAYLSKDFGSAFFMVRNLIDQAINMFLASNGETNPSKKWTYRKLKRYVENHNDKTLLSAYVELQNTPFSNEIDSFVRKGLNFSQKLNYEAQQILKPGAGVN